MFSEFPISAVLLLWLAALPQSSNAIPLSRVETFFDTAPESLSQAIQKTRRNPLVCNTASDNVSGTSTAFPGEIQAGQQKRNPKRPTAGDPVHVQIVDGILTITNRGSQQPEEVSATSTILPKTKRRLAPQKAFTKADMTPRLTTPEPPTTSTLPPFADFGSTDGVVIIMPVDTSHAADGVVGATAQESQQQEDTSAVPNPGIAPEAKQPLISQVDLVRRPTRPKPATTSTLPPFVDFASTDGVTVVRPSGNNGDKQLGSGMNMDTNFNPTVNFTSSGQGAATGDANADSASDLKSQQVSNTQNTDQGSAVQTGSRGTGIGSNVQLSGSSQAKSNGVSQSGKQLLAVRTRDGNIIFVPVDAQNAQSGTTPTQTGTSEGQTFRSSGDTVASGSGTVGTGSATSAQDSQIITNTLGTQSQSSNSGSGKGKDIIVKGAVVSGSEGQGSQQTSQWEGNSQGVPNPQQGKHTWQTDGQQGFSSNGKGGATGEAFSPDGSASSVQNSQTLTNDRGTSIQSSSRSHASGKGVRITGASNSGGNQGFMTFRPSFMNFQFRNPWIF